MAFCSLPKKCGYKIRTLEKHSKRCHSWGWAPPGPVSSRGAAGVALGSSTCLQRAQSSWGCSHHLLIEPQTTSLLGKLKAPSGFCRRQLRALLSPCSPAAQHLSFIASICVLLPFPSLCSGIQYYSEAIATIWMCTKSWANDRKRKSNGYLQGNSQLLIQLGLFLDSVPSSSWLLCVPEWVISIWFALLHGTDRNLFLAATLENKFFILELTHKGKQKKNCIMKAVLIWPQFFQY